jgi:hypothetical protein
MSELLRPTWVDVMWQGYFGPREREVPLLEGV